MRSRIRNTMMILCFALILSFVSCSSTRVDEKKQIYIGVTCYDQKDTFMLQAHSVHRMTRCRR
mgnify:CR=1 FL=1